MKRQLKLGQLVMATLLSSGACTDSPTHQRVEFAKLVFDAPSGWQRDNENDRRGVATTTWVPRNNENKESLVICRTELAPLTARGGAQLLGALLENAYAVRDAQVSTAVFIHTKHGLSGSRVDIDYTPPGLQERYHRVHVVVVEGSSLVHILYTARTSGDLAAFDQVVQSIHQGEG